MSDTLNPTEAVFGFAAWLTTREEKTVMSASDDSAPIVELVEQFCKVNNLPGASEHWPQHLIHPEGEVAVPGVGQNTNICCCQNGDYWREQGSEFCGACGNKI